MLLRLNLSDWSISLSYTIRSLQFEEKDCLLTWGGRTSIDRIFPSGHDFDPVPASSTRADSWKRGVPWFGLTLKSVPIEPDRKIFPGRGGSRASLIYPSDWVYRQTLLGLHIQGLRRATRKGKFFHWLKVEAHALRPVTHGHSGWLTRKHLFRKGLPTARSYTIQLQRPAPEVLLKRKRVAINPLRSEWNRKNILNPSCHRCLWDEAHLATGVNSQAAAFLLIKDMNRPCHSKHKKSRNSPLWKTSVVAGSSVYSYLVASLCFHSPPSG